eukprot:31391-Pelagococcus_subviridis.AAC.14
MECPLRVGTRTFSSFFYSTRRRDERVGGTARARGSTRGRCRGAARNWTESRRRSRALLLARARAAACALPAAANDFDESLH